VKQQEQIQSQLNSYIERRKYVEAEEAEAQARMKQATGQLVSGGSLRSAADKLQECSDKFEELWTDFQTVDRHRAWTPWEADRLGARVQLHKARCGFTSEQVQHFRKVQLENLAALEKNYCGSPASYQKEQQQEVAKILGRMPDCRQYAGLGAQPGNQVVTPPAGTQDAGSASSNQGKLPILRVKSELSDGKLNLRDGPGVRHGVIAELPVGTLLRQIGACVSSDDGITRDPWCKVDWSGTKGWASSSGLEKNNEPQ